MRSTVSWILASALAFAAAAGAFLLLANLSDRPAERPLSPAPEAAEPASKLQVLLNRDQLASLRGAPGQKLTVEVRNTSGRSLSSVNVSLEISSENTAVSGTRYYRETLDELPPKSSANLALTVDLSPPVPNALEETGSTRLFSPPRTIIEVRATTPDAISAVKTAVLSLE